MISIDFKLCGWSRWKGVMENRSMQSKSRPQIPLFKRWQIFVFYFITMISFFLNFLTHYTKIVNWHVLKNVSYSIFLTSFSVNPRMLSFRPPWIFIDEKSIFYIRHSNNQRWINALMLIAFSSLKNMQLDMIISGFSVQKCQFHRRAEQCWLTNTLPSHFILRTDHSLSIQMDHVW